jgi:hypothetical protein
VGSGLVVGLGAVVGAVVGLLRGLGAVVGAVVGLLRGLGAVVGAVVGLLRGLGAVVGAVVGLLRGLGAVVGLLVGLGVVAGVGFGDSCASFKLPPEDAILVPAIAGAIIPVVAIAKTAKRLTGLPIRFIFFIKFNSSFTDAHLSEWVNPTTG